MKIDYGYGRIDWESERDRINLAEVASRLLGPSPGRRGARCSRLWWSCPFHNDPNPSFCVTPGKLTWKCWGCGEHGDAANLVMRLEGLTFPQAVTALTGGLLSTKNARPRPCPKPIDPGPAPPSGLAYADALALVETATARLWTPEGADALAYLTSSQRCLTLETIRAARLGWTPRAVGLAWTPPGIVIPWFVGDRLALVKVRPDPSFRETLPQERRPPKYLEAYRDPSILECYPSPATIQPGRPLIATEGEFDALLLGQELGNAASVITLGSASTRPDRSILRLAQAAPTWYVATDADTAGDKAAEAWPARARRVRPPGSFKDWSEVKAAGVDLGRWWRDRMSGIDPPALFTWDELSRWRWGPSVNDPTPGIDHL